MSRNGSSFADTDTCTAKEKEKMDLKEELRKKIIADREKFKRQLKKEIKEYDAKFTPEEKAEREKVTKAAIEAFRSYPSPTE